MEKYTVFYNTVKIGKLEINEKGEHKYTPDIVGTKTVKPSIQIFHELLEKSDWREPIPLFESRIQDAKKFSQENDISNQTDDFRLVREED